MPKGIQLRRGRPGVRVDADAYLLNHHVSAASLGPSLFLHSLVGDKHSSKKQNKTLKSWKNRGDAKCSEEVHGALNLTLTRFPKPKGQLRRLPLPHPGLPLPPFGEMSSDTRTPHRFTVRTSKALQGGSLASQPPNTAANTCRAEQGAAVGSRSKKQRSRWTQRRRQMYRCYPRFTEEEAEAERG